MMVTNRHILTVSNLEGRMSNEQREDKPERVSLTLTPESVKRLDALRDRIARNRSIVVTRLIDEAFERQEATA